MVTLKGIVDKIRKNRALSGKNSDKEIKADYKIDLSGAPTGYVNTTSGFIPAPGGGGGEKKEIKSFGEVGGNISSGTYDAKDLANIRAKRAGLPAPFPNLLTSEGEKQTTSQAEAEFQAMGGTTIEGRQTKEEIEKQIGRKLTPEEASKLEEDNSNFFSRANEALTFGAVGQGERVLPGQLPSQLGRMAADIIDFYRVGATLKEPMRVAKAKETFSQSKDLLRQEIDLVKAGQMHSTDVVNQILATQEAVNRLERTQKGLGKFNANYWVDEGKAIEAQIIANKAELKNMENELLNLAAMGL